jgi:hypothetical protein
MSLGKGSSINSSGYYQDKSVESLHDFYCDLFVAPAILHSGAFKFAADHSITLVERLDLKQQ